jgi:hypothetical protein
MTQSQFRIRLILGAFFAPLVPYAILGLAVVNGKTEILSSSARPVLLWGLAVFYGWALICGVPSYLIVRRQKWSSRTTYLFVAAGTSLVLLLAVKVSLYALAAYFKARSSPIVDLSTMSLAVVVIVLGAVIASLFWLIVRPDKY